MEIKKDILGIRSECPYVHSHFEDERIRRAKHDLVQIEKLVKEADGNIEDFAIDCIDRGLMYKEVDENTAKWVWVTDYIIKPIKYGGEKLQDCIDRLTLLGAAAGV